MSKVVRTKPPPTVIASHFATAVNLSPTGAISLIDIINAIVSPVFPTGPIRFAIFIALVEGHGRYPIWVKLFNLESRAVLWEERGHISFASPLDHRAYARVLEAVSFPTPGIYILEMTAGTEIILERKLIVQTPPPSPK